MPRTYRQRLQSSVNGVTGGRPPAPLDPHGVAAVRRIKERARKLGGASLGKCVRFWIDVLGDKNARMQDRLRAAENLCDRFGFPKLEAVATIDESVLSMKLVEHRYFEPPPEFNPDPPPPMASDDHPTGPVDATG